MVRHCFKCGHKVSDRDRFCPICGDPLSPPSQNDISQVRDFRAVSSAAPATQSSKPISPSSPIIDGKTKPAYRSGVKAALFVGAIVLVAIAIVGVMSIERRSDKSTATHSPDSSSASIASREQKRQQLEAEKQRLARARQWQQPSAPSLTVSQQRQQPVEMPNQITTAPSAQPAINPPEIKAVARDSDIETSIGAIYQKSGVEGSYAGLYIFSGRVTNTGNVLAPRVEVFVRMKGFLLMPEQVADTDQYGNRSYHEGPGKSFFGGEFSTRIVTLTNLRAGESREVNETIGEPTAQTVTGIPAGYILGSARPTDCSVRATVSESD